MENKVKPSPSKKCKKMVVYTPVVLSGSNLKDRHRNLNNLVQQAFEDNLCVEDVINLHENSPIDRIFKIDLASKYRYVDFILQNLKDDNMLYVSRCLKCFWLLEPQYSNIINPSHLESYVYPEMTLPAVNKMKNWLHVNLKDTNRCQEFYNYYKDNFEFAFKFFWRCSDEFILSEFPNIIDKLSPRHLKILSEKCPESCKLYFEILPNYEVAVSKYVKNQCNYFKNSKYLLKWDTNAFLDIVEKYFDEGCSGSLNSAITRYVLKTCKHRVFAKIELYSSSILHKNTLAASLSSDDAKQLVLQLARATYLEHWFSFKAVEPFIKRINVAERTQLKKQIFVDKHIDFKVETWPYKVPTPLKIEERKINYLILDVDELQTSFDWICHKSYEEEFECECESKISLSPLHQLFKRYRFIGFGRTYYELTLRLLTENTVPGRLNILLVLVSKSGSVPDHIEKLLLFLVQRHLNEPTTLRAAVIRSLVNRQCIWRLPENSWNLLLDFGRNLGLDGLIAEHLCREGLHAVVIRHLLASAPIPHNVLTGFLREHSLLTEYKLSTSEKKLIAKQLPPFFLPSNPDVFLRALKEYNVSIDVFPEVKHVLVKLAQEDSNLLKRLYDSKIIRRELFHEIFAIKQSEAAYMNVLRHDIYPLEQGEAFFLLARKKKRLKHDKFLQSLSLYFSEPGGLAEMHKHFLDDLLKIESKSIVARPLCILSSDKWILSRLSELDSQDDDKTKNKINKQVAAAFRANAHKTNPPLKIDELNWRWLGAKAVANKVFICRERDRQMYLKKLLDWRRTARISIRLAYGTDHDVDIFLQACSIRPVAALKVALSKLLTQKDVDLRIWTAVKLIMRNTDLSRKVYLLEKIYNLDYVSQSIQIDYSIVLLRNFGKFDFFLALCHLKILKRHISEVDKNCIYEIVTEFIKHRLSPLNWREYGGNNKYVYNILYIISKCLLLCESENQQKYVLENICDPFFDAVGNLLKAKQMRNCILLEYLRHFLFSLKYTNAFLWYNSSPDTTLFPVFERILQGLHTILPTHEYFAKYTEINLTIIYYKTIREISETRPELFKDPKNEECTEIVGTQFGKYIGFEIKNLVSKYFRSITTLYKDVLGRYLKTYFTEVFIQRYLGLFVRFIIKGLLEVKCTEATILAVYLFEIFYKNIKSESCENFVKMEFERCGDDETKFLLYSFAHTIKSEAQ